MAFFQNESTQTTLLLPPVFSTDGRDLISNPTIHNWTDFLSDSRHTDRKRAFQEFVFILLYYRNRSFKAFSSGSSKFPHNLLYEKVLQYYVETTPLVISTALTTLAPKNASGNPIFQVQSATNLLVAPVSGLTAPADYLPALRIDSNAIAREVNIGLATGVTSLGFFQEVSTLFAYFYLIRQMILINGYEFRFYAPLVGNPSSSLNWMANPVYRYIDEDNYRNPTSTLPTVVSVRTNRIMAEINYPATDLPYFYNSAIATLASAGFNIPPTLTTDAEKVFMAYFVKLLDPFRSLGVLNTLSSSILSLPTINTGVATSSNRNAILMDPAGVVISSSGENTFIADLIVTMRSGNAGIKDLAGNPVAAGASTRSFYNPPVPYAIGTYVTEARKEIKTIYDDLQSVIQSTVNNESNCMLKILYRDYSGVPNNTILASGVGSVSISLFGIKNFGLPYFNYKLDANSVASPTNSKSSIIDITKNQAVHIGVYALDLFSGSAGMPSNFSIQVDATETYKFKFVPEQPSLGDINISPVPLSSVSNPDFYNVFDATANVWRYYKAMTVATTIIKQIELVAEYDVARRDLRFRKFTSADLVVYGISSTKSLTYTITSNSIPHPYSAGNFIHEELLTLVSIFEDQSPRVFSDDAIYDNDTFQLYNLPNITSPHNFRGINTISYNRLLTDPNEKNAVKFIFDSLKNDLANSTNNTTLLPPVLVGGFVGKKPISSTVSSEKVITDDSYKFKFSAGANSEGTGYSTAEKNRISVLKYSAAEFEITPNVLPPNIPTGVNIKLKIKSYVSPAKSFLETQYTGSGPDDTLFTTLKSGLITSNQILAMLRSFGLLEGLVQRMLEILNASATYSVPEKTYITDKLKEWLPDSTNTAATDAIICIDEIVPGATLRVADISLTNYYLLKRY